jgi:hypothetical protein
LSEGAEHAFQPETVENVVEMSAGYDQEDAGDDDDNDDDKAAIHNSSQERAVAVVGTTEPADIAGPCMMARALVKLLAESRRQGLVSQGLVSSGDETAAATAHLLTHHSFSGTTANVKETEEGSSVNGCNGGGNNDSGRESGSSRMFDDWVSSEFLRAKRKEFRGDVICTWNERSASNHGRQYSSQNTERRSSSNVSAPPSTTTETSAAATTTRGGGGGSDGGDSVGSGGLVLVGDTRGALRLLEAPVLAAVPCSFVVPTAVRKHQRCI